MLHNMCIANNIQLIDQEEENGIEVEVMEVEVINEANAGRINPELLAGRRIRRRIINHINN